MTRNTKTGMAAVSGLVALALLFTHLLHYSSTRVWTAESIAAGEARYRAEMAKEAQEEARRDAQRAERAEKTSKTGGGIPRPVRMALGLGW